MSQKRQSQPLRHKPEVNPRVTKDRGHTPCVTKGGGCTPRVTEDDGVSILHLAAAILCAQYYYHNIAIMQHSEPADVSTEVPSGIIICMSIKCNHG